MYLLGIDGGQTSTKACLYDDELGTCFFASGPPIDHMLTLNGQIKSRQGIQQSLQAVLKRHKPAKQVEMAFVSISGIHKEHEDLIKSWILECIRVDRFLLEGDVKANLAGASGGKNDGVLIIAGGGSIAYCFDGKNEFVAGGYGHVLGDDGSAYWIGLQAIKASIAYGEMRGPSTVMMEQILEHFHETSFWGIKKQIHADLIQRDEIAQLSVLVEQAANGGDKVAQSILKQAGEELGQLVVSVVKQADALRQTAEIRKVYPTGGVFQSARWVLRSMEEELHAYHSALTVCPPQYPPIVGSLILAAQALGRKIDFSIVQSALLGG